MSIMYPHSVETTVIFHEGDDDDHEHEDGPSMPLDEEHPMWRSERIALTSVGIDIGSSTSHLIFSRLVLRRQGIALSSRFVVVKREILHESQILLTPYLDKTTIDTEELDEFIPKAYRQAGVTPNDIDTGALILTGEAAKKKMRRLWLPFFPPRPESLSVLQQAITWRLSLRPMALVRCRRPQPVETNSPL